MRKSTGDDALELAYFTVKEFLLQLSDKDDGEFAAYRVSNGHNENERAKVCLTFLNFRVFDQIGHASRTISEDRFKRYPFRKYAVRHWFKHARGHLTDFELLDLIKSFLNPSKPNTLISWAQDIMQSALSNVHYEDESTQAMTNSPLLEQVRSITPPC